MLRLLDHCIAKLVRHTHILTGLKWLLDFKHVMYMSLLVLQKCKGSTVATKPLCHYYWVSQWQVGLSRFREAWSRVSAIRNTFLSLICHITRLLYSWTGKILVKSFIVRFCVLHSDLHACIGQFIGSPPIPVRKQASKRHVDFCNATD